MAYANVSHMTKLIRIRNVPDDLHKTLKMRAAQAGMTLSGYLLAEIERVTEKPPVFGRGSGYRRRACMSPTPLTWRSPRRSAATFFPAGVTTPTIYPNDNGVRFPGLIPFTETIPPAEQDKKLPQKLRAELAGILAWCVEGCLEWQREGLKAPDEVRKATGAYRSEMDVIGAFLRDECEIGSGYSATFKEVYDRYEEWCEEGGEKPETRRKFNARLKERGQFADRRSGPAGSYEWHGLGLLKKQNTGFAGKLKKRSENDYNRVGNTSCSVNSANSFSSSVTSVEEASEEQQRELRKLVRDGMSEDSARSEVLGKGWVEL